MMVLGMDTAASVCGVSVASGSGLLAGRSSHRPRAHAELLMKMVDECMNEAGRPGGKPEAVAVSGGPGSFTGLRIGFSVAKGICAAAGSALVVVPTFEAWAAAAAETADTPAGSVILTLLSAGRGEVFVASFRSRDGAVVPAEGPSLVGAGDLPGFVAAEARPLIVGETRAELAAWLPSLTGREFVGIVDDGIDIAGRIALAGLEMFAAGRVSDHAAAEPAYGRDFSTTTPNKRKGAF